MVWMLSRSRFSSTLARTQACVSLAGMPLSIASTPVAPMRGYKSRPMTGTASLTSLNRLARAAENSRWVGGLRFPLRVNSVPMAAARPCSSATVESTDAGFSSPPLPSKAMFDGGVKYQKALRAQRAQAGILSIRNTWNNTLINISTIDYKTLGVVTGGSAGFKKSKRSSFFAAEKVIIDAFAKARKFGFRKVMVNMTGPAIVMRKPMLKQMREESNVRIMKLRMSDSVPHGGCRPRKSRRRRFRTRARR